MKQDLSKNEAVEKLLKPREAWRIMKNVLVVSVAFMLQFMAYNGAANLQSSINAEGGLGAASLAAVYAGLVFSSLLLPAVVIRLLGCKWGMSVSFLAYMPYIAAQLLPRFWTLIPAGLLQGLGGGGLWCSKCTYLSALSEAHEKISGIPAEVTLTRFFGIFYTIYHFNQVLGNLISSLVLSSGDNAAAVTTVNATMIPEICGANFLSSSHAEEAFQQQPAIKIYIIIGLYLACIAGASLLVAVCVDSKNRYAPLLTGVTKEPPSGVDLLAVTMKLLLEPELQLMIPLAIFIGMEEGFIGSDFTAAFVSCAIGTGSVGFVMMFFGVVNAVGSLIVGYLARVTGRLPIMIAALLAHTGIVITLLAWKPQAHVPYVIYAIAVVWGFCDAVWTVVINSFFGTLFQGREQGAYSSFYMWVSVGFIISYVISPRMRMRSKTYVLLVFLLVGVAGYLVVELRLRLKLRKKQSETEKTVAVYLTK